MLKEIAAEQAASVVKEQMKKQKGKKQTKTGKWNAYSVISNSSNHNNLFSNDIVNLNNLFVEFRK